MAIAKTKTQPASGSSNGSSTQVSAGTCVISKDTSLEGVFNSDSDVRLDGFVKGDVRCTKRLVMGQTGQVKGTILAESAVIMGKIEGELEVKDSLHLKSTAVINGNIKAKIMTVEEGAEFNGECRIGSPS
ncbi:MAG: polymer-forming cytoskeletal protein [Saprospiraceae bacterium]|nr:polymer-forming cytoskeletal protein [Saprospiraceae bacterium]